VIFVDEREDHLNPLGIKGVGEIGIVGHRSRYRQCGLLHDADPSTRP